LQPLQQFSIEALKTFSKDILTAFDFIMNRFNLSFSHQTLFEGATQSLSSSFFNQLYVEGLKLALPFIVLEQ